jgi:putative aminopeptidase FrvX
MDKLLKEILEASGISGYEKEITAIMVRELKKSCDSVQVDSIGNVIAKKGKGKKKIMLAAHMDEIGFMVKYISKEGFLSFIKVGGIDDRVLVAQRVVVKGKKGDRVGVIGTKPPHLQDDDDRKKPLKYTDMFIDVGARSKEEANEIGVNVGDVIIFEPNAGVLHKDLYYGKAIDNRVSCYALIEIMKKVKADAQVFAVATTQEEVGLKGARVGAFGITPDYAIALDTNLAGDTPQVKEQESSLKLGDGAGITILEAAGRGVIVSEFMRDTLLNTAKKNKIKHQVAIIEGGMTDGAILYMNQAGVHTGVLTVPTRYIHSSTGVFSKNDLDAQIELAVKAVEALA